MVDYTSLLQGEAYMYVTATISVIFINKTYRPTREEILA